MSEKDYINDEQNENNAVGAKSKPRGLTIALVVLLVLLICFEGIVLYRKIFDRPPRTKYANTIERSADDAFIKEYFPFSTNEKGKGLMSQNVVELLGKSYSEICRLSGHEESSVDLENDSDGFYLDVTDDTPYTVDLHFKKGVLYRASIYCNSLDYDTVLAAAEDRASMDDSDIFRYIEEKKRRCYLYSDTCDYWLWEMDGRVCQQFILRMNDNIGYYLVDGTFTGDYTRGFFSERCEGLLNKSYSQICEQFDYEKSESDYFDEGLAEFYYSVFSYDDSSRDTTVKFEFSEDKLYKITATKNECPPEMYEALKERAVKLFGEPYNTLDTGEGCFFKVNEDTEYWIEHFSDGMIKQKYIHIKINTH